ncbi:hypothetical protein SFLOR_v1c05180 [Spiroplasma floricola 23-6]|uniref:Uncharacterized protein n=1 Tax=Spiroplasma floricola 23-6 TaxID=1336749 RepID=A0A2K8SFG0_9MOLU|nr:hypothetical protein SFLOR_v1c05180 [Spiroplasma floricola 23-6]
MRNNIMRNLNFLKGMKNKYREEKNIYFLFKKIFSIKNYLKVNINLFLILKYSNTISLEQYYINWW